MFQPINITKLTSITIVIYLDGKYALFHLTTDLVGAAAKVQTLACNEIAFIQTQYNRATTYYNIIPTNGFYLE